MHRQHSGGFPMDCASVYEITTYVFLTSNLTYFLTTNINTLDICERLTI